MEFNEMVREMALERIEVLEDEKGELANRWRDLHDEILILRAGLKKLKEPEKQDGEIDIDSYFV